MIVFNLAGYGVHPREDDEALARRLNLGVVQELRQAMAVQAPTSWFGQHIVHAGSALEYGTAGGILSEDVECRPTTLYGRTKFEATRVLSAAVEMGALRALTARLFTVYGPGEGPWRLLPSLRRVTSLKQPLAMTAGHQKRDFTYIGDVAEGLLLLGTLTSVEVDPVNLATGVLLPVRDFAELAAHQLRLPAELLQFGVLPTREWEMDHDPVPIGRLVNLTGWRPLTVPAEGIQRTLAYFETHDSDL
jgi:nucleoside-diphosphate-sugar epimerase